MVIVRAATCIIHRNYQLIGKITIYNYMLISIVILFLYKFSALRITKIDALKIKIKKIDRNNLTC